MKKLFRRIVSVMMVTAMVVTLIPALESVQADDEPYNLSEGRAVYASSANGGDTEDRAVDGKTNTRWQAATSDSNEWLYVDLGKKANLDHIYMHWEAAYAKYYKIETSDDEIEWTTAYEKKKGEAQHKTMAVSYKYTGTRADGNYRFSVNWTKVEDAHYKVYIDGEDNDHIAYAGGDNYRFTNHGGTQGDIRMSQGEHYMIVVAFNPDNNEELGRGVLDLDAQVDAQGDNGIDDDPADALKQTINKDELSVTEARYVRITCTQRATGYGCSLYEFQVWGTGGSNKPPAQYGENLALNKTVKCSGTRDEWWMKDADGNIKPDAYDQVKPENAVDGSKDTAFTSYQGEDDQWIYVDLGAEYDIGRVITRFNEDAGKIYDIQTSKDAKHWTTIHREQKGFMNKVDNFTCFHEDVRFVRFLGYSKVESGSGFGIRELEVYEYKEGDSKENETIKDLPISQIVNNENGKGSYVVGEVKKELNKLPSFVNEENITTPIDSNSWWSSFMIKTYGNMAVIHPLKAQFSSKGLGTLLASQGYTDERKPQDLGVGYYSEKLMDFYLKPDSFDANSGYDRVENYGDFHVDVGLCDDEGLKMKSTLVKGSPYIFSEFYEDDTVLLSSSSIFKIDNKNGQRVLENAGDTYTGDHIVIHTQDDENFRAENGESDFLICTPENTTFTAKNVGKKTLLKIQFESKDNAYISACGMHAEAQVEEYYQRAYNHVTRTEVSYDFNKSNNKVTTTYSASTDIMRDDLSSNTVLGFYPHQWKHESENCAGHFDTYKSIRGDMRMYTSNELSTTQQFAGLLPTFAKPNSSKLEKDRIKGYIKTVVDEIGTGPNADAYWQGKAVHPLAITALMADQIGETKMRDQLLKDLKKIMVDWFTYSGGDDRCYLIYNKDWGTIYYPESAYGANAAICDHHFTYGYFLFGAAVLSCYDQDFYYQYKDMVELMLRDYADPEEPRNDDNMFCKFRAFDQYSGHSWAGGYADNDDGNNQESASESLFSWVGMYLWGEVSKQQKYIDAGAYGFTTEMEAVKQYWFDYDGDNWLDSFPFQGTGQVYGASYSYGTFFGGQPLYIYGIQWLPISEYLTNYGMDQEKCARAYQGLLDETDDAREKVMINANIVAEQMRQQGKSQEEIDAYLAQEQHTADTYPTADTGWQHITWPFLSQTDPDAAYEKFTAGVNGVQKEDRANTYWFISAMDSIGYKTTDYVITGATLSGSVYKKVKDGNTVYTGEIWNPTQEVKTTYVVDSSSGEKIGKVKVKAGSLVQFEIDTAGGFDLLLGNEESGGGEETTTPAEDETVQPPADVKDWIPDSRFNLALNKEVSVSSIYKNEGSQDASVLVDGNLNSPYVSTDWDNERTEDRIIIDLGENYHPSDINKIAMQFKNDQAVFCNQYTVEVSADDNTYYQCVTKNFTNDQYDNGFISFDIDTMPAISSVRYVRIRMIGHKNWGFQIREAAVLTRNSKATPVPVEKCDDPADLELSSDEPLKIKYNIVAGPNQHDYMYNVYLDGKKYNTCGSGEGVISALAGKHTVKVRSFYDGKYSDGISETIEVDDGSLRNYCNTALNYALGAHATLETFSDRNEGSKDPKMLTDGNINGNFNMTVWGEDNATATLELLEPVDIDDINEVLIKYVNDITYAKGFNVQFSKDGTNYETVYSTNNCEYADPVEVKIDKGAYTQGDVNYVKVNFTQKSAGYGYQIREIAVLGDPDAYLPANPEGLSLSSTEGGSITVNFTSVLGSTATYNVYVDDQLVGLHLPSAGSYTFKHLDGGKHTVKVTAVQNNIESKGVTAKITIEDPAPPETEPDYDDDPDDPIVTRPTSTPKPITTKAPTESQTQAPTDIPGGDTTTPEPITVAPSAQPTQAPGKTTVAPTGKCKPVPPAKVKVKKALKKKSAKKLTVKIKKLVGVKGYEVRVYKSKKNAKKNKKAIVKKFINKNKAKLVIKSKKLKGKKKLFARVRAKKIDCGQTVFGAWSKPKKVKIK